MMIMFALDKKICLTVRPNPELRITNKLIKSQIKLKVNLYNPVWKIFIITKNYKHL